MFFLLSELPKRKESPLWKERENACIHLLKENKMKFNSIHDESQDFEFGDVKKLTVEYLLDPKCRIKCKVWIYIMYFQWMPLWLPQLLYTEYPKYYPELQSLWICIMSPTSIWNDDMGYMSYWPCGRLLFVYFYIYPLAYCSYPWPLQMIHIHFLASPLSLWWWVLFTGQITLSFLLH